MPKTAHEPTATVPGSGLGPATLLVMPPEMAMDTVTALAAVLALGLTMARVLAVGLVPGPATALGALAVLARAHIMVGAAGAGSACGRGRRR